MWKTQLPVPEPATGLQHHTWQCPVDHAAVCPAGGRARPSHDGRVRANAAVTSGWDGTLAGDVTSLTWTGLWDAHL